MAGIVVQSRFAGLLVEGEDYSSSSDAQKKKPKTNAAKKPEPSKKVKSVPSKTQAPKKKKSKPAAVSETQWEEWKQKDEQLVDGNFEDELQQAILLSKLDYEEKKDVYQQLKKEADVSKKLEVTKNTNNKKQQKKKNVMSLEQFNNMVSGGEETEVNNEEEKPIEQKIEKSKDDTEFFERVKSETKNELLKDKIIDRVKLRQATPDINRVQFADALERKDREINELKEEITHLKKELVTVKSRNKKLCNILGQGEMKDKAEVLVEVERLLAVQEELTAEIASLHTDLEKERSKNADPRTKDKKNSTKKKNIRFDVSSEALITKESTSGTA